MHGEYYIVIIITATLVCHRSRTYTNCDNTLACRSSKPPRTTSTPGFVIYVNCLAFVLPRSSQWISIVAVVYIHCWWRK